MDKYCKSIIDKLEKLYEHDSDALDEIQRSKETIEYYETKGDVEKARNESVMLEAFLHDWY